MSSIQDSTARKLPELLAPAGSPAALRAAVSAGADAVYLGAKAFNARNGAANFSSGELAECTAFAHSRGVRVYVTLNTLVYDRECADFIKTAADARAAGCDGFIITDLGAAGLLAEYFPDVPLHASTQMSIHSSGAAAALRSLGVSRVVLARELSLSDIRSFTRNLPDIEAEIFVHGALCVCHSGQCLFSSFVGGRSGNRGECAQPCRLPYRRDGKTVYPLSLKDLCLAEHIPELLDSGVSSLKIEGRMKSPGYVAAVVSVWRRLLDERRNATPAEMEYLEKVFSRSGFTDAYFTGRISRSMLGTRTETQKDSPLPSPLYPQPSDRDRLNPIEKPIPASVNGLPDRFPNNFSADRVSQKTAVIFRPAQYTQKAASFFDLSYIPLEYYAEAASLGSVPRGVMLPPVIRDSETREIEKMLKAAVSLGATDLLVNNLSHLQLALGSGMRVHGGHMLNICNSGSAGRVIDLGFSDFILSPELTLPRIRDIGGPSSVIVYGRVPLMITEKCVGKECSGCRQCGLDANILTDRRGVGFPVLRAWPHRSQIFNSVPIWMADRDRQLREYGIKRKVFLFSVESPDEVDSVIKAEITGAPPPDRSGFRRIAVK